MSLEAITRNVEATVTSHTTRDTLDAVGLVATKVAWEDNARTKNSSTGPCISDMTLQVNGRAMPIMREPNFTDVTWDVPLDKIMLKVGNEHGQPLRAVSLQEYLNNFPDYLSEPTRWKEVPGTARPRALSRVDVGEQGTMSAQACLLPLPEDGGEVPFNVAIYNYQSTKQHPAVLVLVATDSGTSAQIVTNGPGRYQPQTLYINNNGRCASHVACRLKEDRISRGQTTDLDAPMTSEEKLRNAIRIIQVPLRWKETAAAATQFKGFSFGGGSKDAGAGFSFGGMSGTFLPELGSMGPTEEPESEDMEVEESDGILFPESGHEPTLPAVKTDVVDAMVSVGKKDEGSFSELGGLAIERDVRWPVRITVQYYKATSNGRISAEVASDIKARLDEAKAFATRIGSLVTGPTCPPWWGEYWRVFKHRYAHFFPAGEEAAARFVFAKGRYHTQSQATASPKIAALLEALPTGWTFTQ